MTPNDGVAFTTKSEETDVHAAYRMKLTWSVNPNICHICGKNHYVNMCLDREENAPKKKSDKGQGHPQERKRPH